MKRYIYIYRRKAKRCGGEGKGVDRGKGIYIEGKQREVEEKEKE